MMAVVDCSGAALRTFDVQDRLWSIYWVSSRDGLLQPPVTGRFNAGVGQFEGDDVDNGRAVKVRFLWHSITPVSARWEQAFSIDHGAGWETDWTMDFARLAA